MAAADEYPGSKETKAFEAGGKRCRFLVDEPDGYQRASQPEQSGGMLAASDSPSTDVETR